MSRAITLGSLFDGSGGFPLAGIMCGIRPLWASEIDSFCVSVTSNRFPKMKHLGDVTKINGANIPPVDIITFGSPCQDMSVAGKRAGLEGERSVLFMDAVRIIKEMRGATNGKYPKIIIWENVPGAFSSNKGEDFRTVLEELSKIEDRNVSIPHPQKGKWNKSGCIVGDNFSLAWRVLDAQFWGVPQRRKRIFLIGSFGSECAAEILFKREGLSRDFKESRETWKRLAPSPKSSTGISINADGSNVEINSSQSCHTLVFDSTQITSQTNRSNPQLNAPCHTLAATSSSPVLCASFYPQMKAESQAYREDNISNTLVNGTSAGFHNAVLYHSDIVLNDQGGSSISVEKNICPTLRAQAHGNEPCVMCDSNGKIHSDIVPSLSDDFKPKTLKIRCGCEGGGKGALIQVDKSATLSCNNDQILLVPPAETAECCLCLSGNTIDRKPENGGNGKGYQDNVSYTLNTIDRHAVMSPQYSIDRAAFNQGENALYSFSISDKTVQTLTAKGPSAVCCNAEEDVTISLFENHGKDSRYKGPVETSPTIAAAYGTGGNNTPFAVKHGIDVSSYIVRRITPLECCRLQGFPDWWCKDVPHKDTPEYRMWGNGVALPCVLYVMEGIAEVLMRESHSD